MLPTDRRRFFGTVAGAAALTAMPLPAAAAPAGVPAPPAAPIQTKKIPKTGEVVPAIGMGTFMTFDLLPGQPRDHLREVMRRFWEGGGRLIDTSPLYGLAEVSVGDFATSLGINNEIFFTNKIWSTGEFLGDDSHALRSLEQSRQRLWRDKIDVMQVHSLVNVDQIVPILQRWKAEGRIRHVGVTHHELPYFGALAQWVERADLDFVQVHYSIHTRLAEERVLKAAAERGIAVLVNMPFEKARLFKIVEGQKLPDFARELGITTWAAYFLKWIVSHPAVTAALPATTNPEHAAENIAALRGPLPDAAMRDRMVRHMETIPGFDKLAEMPSYPDKKFTGAAKLPQRPPAPKPT